MVTYNNNSTKFSERKCQRTICVPKIVLWSIYLDYLAVQTHVHTHARTQIGKVFIWLRYCLLHLYILHLHHHSITHVYFHFDIILYLICLFFIFCCCFVSVMPIATCHRCFHEFICKFSVFGLHFMNLENV